MRKLEDFIGMYDVSRTIEDTRAGATSRFEGQAEITLTQDGALYSETGALIISDQRFEAERRYLWAEEHGKILVSFEDGRAFHDFDPNLGGQASEHLCGKDMYRGGYEFSEWPRWALHWRVQGPRKDYVSTTWYVRC
ncbi:hypothetical protein SAMN05444287_1638 [Octadecabacter temperatus]|uniref:Uncharacterized protein n=1 Tax=Octadecabacter temperatus TaxID=1458307 RepID=A0A0K0Y6J7_9RHOB|nr:DUF6314 family protein [Octadecabacter temperatus]AKS46521.1 hypothetical protein OSB_19820 [Octadecabacter temperatus]SIO15739.1 hypothetical protein SAMN05444287_1638 [Octadecabacter temperatus]